MAIGWGVERQECGMLKWRRYSRAHSVGQGLGAPALAKVDFSCKAPSSPAAQPATEHILHAGKRMSAGRSRTYGGEMRNVNVSPIAGIRFRLLLIRHDSV